MRHSTVSTALSLRPLAGGAGIPPSSSPQGARAGITLSSRRALLTGLAASAVSLAATRHAQARGKRLRTLDLFNINTDEPLKLVYWLDGAYLGDSLRAIERLLRDWHAERSHPIDVRLIDGLYRLQRELDSRSPLVVLSGFRTSDTNAMLRRRGFHVAQDSFHLRGMALDCTVPDRRLSELRDAARAVGFGGIGYYPRNRFIHVDTGPAREWTL